MIHCMVYRLFIFIISLVFVGSSWSEIFSDQTGVEFSFENPVTKVYGASPPVTAMLGALKPEVVVGLNFPLSKEQLAVMPSYYAGLPVVGGWFGKGRTPNLEAILSLKPQLVMDWYMEGAASRIEKTFAPYSIPVFHLKMDKIHEYPAAMILMGKVLGTESRGLELAKLASNYLDITIKGMLSHKQEKPKRVYYAEGSDGLLSECENSIHITPLKLLGAQSVHQCEGMPGGHYGMVYVSMERILMYDPDLIIVHDPEFFRIISGDDRWKQLRAVKNRDYYLIPSVPFNWLDRPPSFMRLLGIRWLSHLLYENPSKPQLIKEIQKFFHVFFKTELSEEEVISMLKLPEEGS